jgi:hypothetical protein
MSLSYTSHAQGLCPLLRLFNEICYLPKESSLDIQTRPRKITNMHMAVSTDLFPERGTPLNLSRSLALASSTAPGSLSFSVNLGLLKFSVLALLLETNWLVLWSSRTDARSLARQENIQIRGNKSMNLQALNHKTNIDFQL